MPEPFTNRDGQDNHPGTVGWARQLQSRSAARRLHHHRRHLVVGRLALDSGGRRKLRLIKTATRVLPADWASKTESALRIFGADRALLLVEGIALAKLIMLGVAQPFRRRRP